MMDELSDDPSFFRQRRNLMSISLLILIVNAAGAHVDHVNLQVVGAISFDRPKMIPWISAAMLTYFVIRYCQYWLQLPVSAVRQHFFGLVDHALKKPLLAHLKRDSASEASKHNYQLNSFSVSMYSRHPRPPVYTAAIQHTDANGLNSAVTFVDVPSWHVAGAFFKAYLNLLFVSKVGTEYLFPLVLSVVAYISFAPGFKSLMTALFA